MHRWQSCSSVDLIRAGREPVHRDAFVNQCHNTEKQTHSHTYKYKHTHTHSTYNVGLREWWSRELTSDALLFLHYWWYQSTQEGCSKKEYSVCVYCMCVWIYSMFVLLRFNINALYAYSAAISFSRGNSEGQTWNTSVTLLNTSKCLQNHIID